MEPESVGAPFIKVNNPSGYLKANQTLSETDSLVYWNWGTYVNQFAQAPNYQPAFSKTLNNQLPRSEINFDTKKMAWTMTYHKYQTPINLAYGKFQTPYSTKTSKFRTPNNFAYLKLQTPNKHISCSISEGVPRGVY